MCFFFIILVLLRMNFIWCVIPPARSESRNHLFEKLVVILICLNCLKVMFGQNL